MDSGLQYFKEQVLTPEKTFEKKFEGFSANKLGLNSNQFQALKLVLRTLDSVFRFADSKYLDKKNTVADHSISTARKIEDLFKSIDLNRKELGNNNYESLVRTRKPALLSALVHDAGELIWEISTHDSRSHSKEHIQTKDRHKLERKIALLAFKLATDAVKNNDESILTKVVKEFREKVRDNPQHSSEVLNDLVKTTTTTTTDKDIYKFIRAFDRAEKRQDLIGIITKAMDFADGNEFICSNGKNLEKRGDKAVVPLINKTKELTKILNRYKKLIENTVSKLKENLVEVVAKHHPGFKRVADILVD